MIPRCEICGLRTIPLDDAGRREFQCNCVQREDLPPCGCGCGKRVDDGYAESRVYGLMRPECFARHMVNVELGLDEEDG